MQSKESGARVTITDFFMAHYYSQGVFGTLDMKQFLSHQRQGSFVRSCRLMVVTANGACSAWNCAAKVACQLRDTEWILGISRVSADRWSVMEVMMV